MMKLSEEDRLKAIARCPAYIREHNEILSDASKAKVLSKAKINDLCAKWKLKVPIHVDLLPSNDNKQDEDGLNLLSRLIEINQIKAVEVVEKGETSGDSRSILIQVNLDRTNKEIFTTFKDVISSRKRNMPKGRIRKHCEYDPWYIYDLVNRIYKYDMSELKWKELARKLKSEHKPETKYSDTNEYNLTAVRKGLKKAYEWASRAVEEVSRRYSKSYP